MNGDKDVQKKVVCHDIQNREFEVDADKLIFRPSVYGVLIEQDRILLSRQWDGYDFPGGGVDVHETIEAALKREFFEETGVKIELVQPVYCVTSFFHPSHSKTNKDQYWNCPLTYFLVRKVGGQLSKDNLDKEEQDYADMPEWVDSDQVGKIRFYTSVNAGQVIEKALESLRH